MLRLVAEEPESWIRSHALPSYRLAMMPQALDDIAHKCRDRSSGFASAGLEELRLAEQCGHEGQRLSPSQLAAALIEHGLEELKKTKVA